MYGMQDNVITLYTCLCTLRDVYVSKILYTKMIQYMYQEFVQDIMVNDFTSLANCIQEEDRSCVSKLNKPLSLWQSSFELPLFTP